MNLPPPACLSMCLAPPSSEFSLVIFYYEISFLLFSAHKVSLLE